MIPVFETKFCLESNFDPSNLEADQDILFLIQDLQKLPPVLEALFQHEFDRPLFIDALEKPFSKQSFYRPFKGGMQKIVVLNIAHLSEPIADSWLKAGGAAMQAIGKSQKLHIVFVLEEDPTSETVRDFFEGFYLAAYQFRKYFHKKNKSQSFCLKDLSLHLPLGLSEADCLGALEQAKIVAEGVYTARDLVNEPSNILTPSAFAAHIQDLASLGLKITILEESALENLGMNALLAVGRGSRQATKLAILEWQGASETEAPLVFVGKGITFDSGGISLKPGLKMEDMKGDMGGAAAVFGLMQVVAKRAAKAHIIGLIALAENMPDGAAQKPGDIITSLSNQTIEIVNTDAEGRLILADTLFYAAEHYKPKAMINLATLTGAIVIALGTCHAGLFSNNEALADQLINAGLTTNERLWRLPLDPAYDKLIDSKFADMKNSAGRQASAITAAQFLQRFVGDTPWAHLDIAGTASDIPHHEYHRSWATGFGVRLLNCFIKNNFES